MPAVPKPTPRKSERRRKRREEATWVKAIREQVVDRDQGCRACQGMGTAPDLTLPFQMHELVYRSHTRGRPIEERVNTRVCVLLCARCHRDLHKKRLAVHIKDGTTGADGALMFKLWKDNK